jgi:hypothetical protein
VALGGIALGACSRSSNAVQLSCSGVQRRCDGVPDGGTVLNGECHPSVRVCRRRRYKQRTWRYSKAYIALCFFISERATATALHTNKFPGSGLFSLARPQLKTDCRKPITPSYFLPSLSVAYVFITHPLHRHRYHDLHGRRRTLLTRFLTRSLLTARIGTSPRSAQE